MPQQIATTTIEYILKGIGIDPVIAQELYDTVKDWNESRYVHVMGASVFIEEQDDGVSIDIFDDENEEIYTFHISGASVSKKKISFFT